MVMHPGPDARFAKWCEEKKLKWIGVDCGSADHPMNTKIRDWMPAQAQQCEVYFQEKFGKSLPEVFTPEMYQMMHLWMFHKGIIHAECVGGDIDLLVNRRVQVGCFPWRFVDGEASIARIVAMVDDDESLFAAMQAGARGYLLKGAAKSEILRAIRDVAAGAAIFSPAIASRMMTYFSQMQRQANFAFPELTEREREILQLVAHHQTNQEIAQSLHLSPKTVRNYISNIFAKLQVADRAEAIIRARDAGLGK